MPDLKCSGAFAIFRLPLVRRRGKRGRSCLCFCDTMRWRTWPCLRPNIIAAAAVGAVAADRDALGLTIAVIGTPAEENGDTGGKILLLERGAFDGMHAAMMIHPAPFDVLTPKVIAATMFDVHYTGKEAHASAFPEMGINAADALTIAQTAIGLLRQHIPPRYSWNCHHGGDAPNVVPAHTTARYIVRGDNLSELEQLRPRVYKCFEAGALATGCKVEIVGGEKPYSEMIHDPDIAGCFKHNSELLGRCFPDIGAAQQKVVASTDMGNVSLAVPSIQPMIGIDSFPAVNHQREFTAHCITAAADQALFDGALAMAWTAVDLAVDGKIRTRLLSRKR